MAIDRPNVFSVKSSVNFLAWLTALTPTIDIENFKYLKVVCQTGSIKITSSSGSGAFDAIILNSSGSQSDDSVLELTAPEGTSFSDVRIVKDTSTGVEATGMLYYVK